MSKRKIQAIAVASLLVLVAVWYFTTTPTAKTDEARYRQLIGTARSHGRALSIERRLPKNLVRLFHLDDLETKYRERYDALKQALVSSGYLVEVSLVVTNRPVLQTFYLVQKAFQGTGAFYAIRGSAWTNEIVVTCRPENVPICRKAVSGD